WGDNAPLYEIVPLSWVKPPRRSARKHSRQQIDKIKASYRTLGVVAPIIVDGDYNLIAGNGRLKALKRLKAPTVSVIGSST
ncbi:MAG: ParB N-terminal domain-containing protein, partial [Sphingomonas sp.]|nr:ParB N-terminal domain-containing protein [Sphingomonas sp.]